MADEAVVKIVLKDEGSSPSAAGGGASAESTRIRLAREKHEADQLRLSRERSEAESREFQKKLARAYQQGTASPWAPPNQAIPVPELPGVKRDHAELIRDQAEAARRGMEFHDFKKAEKASLHHGGPALPPVLSASPPSPPGPTPEEARAARQDDRRERLEAAREASRQAAAVRGADNALQAMTSATENMAKGLKSMPEPHRPGPTEYMAPPERPKVATTAHEDIAPEIDRHLPPRPPTVPTKTTDKPTDSAAKLDQSIQEVVEIIVKGTAAGIRTRTRADPAQMAKWEKEEREEDELNREARAYLKVALAQRKASIDLELKEKKAIELEARATLETIRKRQQEQAARAAGRFDPVEEAHAKYEASQRQAAINEAYEEIYGKKRSFAEKFTDVVRDPKGSLIDALPGGVGGIVTAVLAADQAAKGAVRTGIGAVRGFGEAIASANDDPSESIGRLGDAASAAGEKIPVLGIAAVAAGESLKALSSIMRSLDQTAERYGQYSPEIAQAQAVAEVRQAMGDFRRAQEVGAEMAKYIQARSDIQQKFEDIKVKLLTKMLPIITRVLEILESIMSGGENIASAITGLVAPLSAITGGADRISQTMQDVTRQPPVDPTEMLNNPRMMTHENDWVRGPAGDRPSGVVPNR